MPLSAGVTTAARGQGRTYGGRSAAERAAERRATFMGAGLELFGTRAYDDVSVAAVVAEAGETRRAFYELFDDREALLRAVHDEIVAGELAHSLAAAGPPPATAAAVEPAVRALVDYYVEDPRRARVQFVTVVGVSPAFEAHRRATFRAIAEQLGAWLGDAAGADAAARRRAALALAGAVSELVMDWLWAQDEPIELLAHEIVTLAQARFFPAETGRTSPRRPGQTVRP